MKNNAVNVLNTDESDLEQKLVPLGYMGLFASRENLNDVFKWCNLHHEQERIHIMTAAGMAVNTLLKALYSAGYLRLEANKPRRMVVVMENGVYQTTLANFDCKDIELAYVECDDNGLDKDMIAIPQSNGNLSLAYASIGNEVILESERTLNIDQVFKVIQEENSHGNV